MARSVTELLEAFRDRREQHIRGATELIRECKLAAKPEVLMATYLGNLGAFNEAIMLCEDFLDDQPVGEQLDNNPAI